MKTLDKTIEFDNNNKIICKKFLFEIEVPLIPTII